MVFTADKHPIVRLDNMLGTTANSYLDSIRFYDANNEEAEIENGSVVLVGDLLQDERELHKATAVAANSDVKSVGLVANPEVMYDERLRDIVYYTNRAGQNVRIYYLHSGDEFSVTPDGFKTATNYKVAVGDAVELAAGTQMQIVKTATSGSTQVGKVIAVEKAGRYTFIVVRVA